MRIAVVGKGGSGKSTTSSLLCQLLEHRGEPVIAMDADINQHLWRGLGFSSQDAKKVPEVGNDLPTLKKILAGNNSLIPRDPNMSQMIKTTLPGKGSHLIYNTPNDPVLSRYALKRGSLSHIRLGGMTEEDIGTRCYHSKTGGAELILNHLMDGKDDNVVIDMTAGADAFASGLFTRFDATIVVVEPTLQSLDVYKQYKEYAKDYGINIKVVGNKVQNAEDLAFLQKHCGSDLLGAMSPSGWVKKWQQGATPTFKEFVSSEEGNVQALDKILGHGKSIERNWTQYWDWGVHFHNKNAKSWANEDVGTDVRTHIDPEFVKTIRPTEEEMKLAQERVPTFMERLGTLKQQKGLLFGIGAIVGIGTILYNKSHENRLENQNLSSNKEDNQLSTGR